jgi:hypothetical protein
VKKGQSLIARRLIALNSIVNRFKRNSLTFKKKGGSPFKDSSPQKGTKLRGRRSYER